MNYFLNDLIYLIELIFTEQFDRFDIDAQIIKQKYNSNLTPGKEVDEENKKFINQLLKDIKKYQEILLTKEEQAQNTKDVLEQEIRRLNETRTNAQKEVQKQQIYKSYGGKQRENDINDAIQNVLLDVNCECIDNALNFVEGGYYHYVKCLIDTLEDIKYGYDLSLIIENTQQLIDKFREKNNLTYEKIKSLSVFDEDAGEDDEDY